jgi:hypothetical protein
MAISRFKTSTLAQGLPKYQKLWDGISEVVASDYELIEQVTVGVGGSSTVSFTSIPSTYKHLQIRFIGRDSTNNEAGMYWTYNSDSGSNYNRHLLRGSGAAASASGYTSAQTKAGSGYMLPNGSSIFASGVIDILDYANTSKYKTSKMLGGYDSNGGGFIILSSSLWMNTSAISSIDFTCETTWAQYSSFGLYGIKGAA